MDEYIGVLKKSQSGDLDALDELLDLMTDLTDLAEKISDAKGAMTTTQMNRFSKLQAKMAKAAY